VARAAGLSRSQLIRAAVNLLLPPEKDVRRY
jgi:hypothetical protein